MAWATVFTSAPGIFSHKLAIVLMKLILVASNALRAGLFGRVREDNSRKDKAENVELSASED
jgi:hypothetical protein